MRTALPVARISLSPRIRFASLRRSSGIIPAMLVLLTWFWHSSAAAQSDITARAATQIIDGCVAQAKGQGQSHAIAVYDRGGQPVALLRMDGNPPGVTDFAMQKAASIAHWQFSTAEMQTTAKETPGFGAAPKVVTVPGGVPVYASDGKLFVGAGGVSGEAPGDDAACAEAGVKAAGFSVKRKTAG